MRGAWTFVFYVKIKIAITCMESWRCISIFVQFGFFSFPVCLSKSSRYEHRENECGIGEDLRQSMVKTWLLVESTVQQPNAIPSRLQLLRESCPRIPPRLDVLQSPSHRTLDPCSTKE
jgi:hypothetical protein